MTNRDLRCDDPWSNDDGPLVKRIEGLLFYLNQPTYITLLVTITFYLVVSIYFINYFDRLALPFYTLNFPLSFYLNAGHGILKASLYILINFLLISAFIYYYIKFAKRVYIRTKIRVIRKTKNVNIHHLNAKLKEYEKEILGLQLLITIFLILLLIYSPLTPSIPSGFLPIFIENLELNYMNSVRWDIPIILKDLMPFLGGMFIGAIMAIFLIISSFLYIKLEMKYENKIFLVRSEIQSFVNNTWTKAIIWIIILTMLSTLMVMVPARLGYFAAEDLIYGKSDHYEMNFSINDTGGKQNYSNMILITQCNNNYYLVRKMLNTSLSNTTLFIIPERIVQNITVKKCKYNKS